MTEPLVLEPSPSKQGEVPENVIIALRAQYSEVASYSQDLTEAFKVQAEKYGIKPGALRRYVAALEHDKLEDTAAECKDLERLIG
jgi:hypothetical protein